MAIGTNIWRVVYDFDLGGDGEVCQTGFYARWAIADPTLPANADALAAHAVSQWSDAFNTFVANFSSALTLTAAKVYHVVPGAPSDNIGMAAASGGDAWSGTGATSLPWECSLVMTLETSHARQVQPRRKRGRMYLPPLSAATLESGDTGFVASGTFDQLLPATLALLEGFNDSVSGTEARVVVYSPKGGFTTDVVFVSADQKMDAQRRRENRQKGWTRTNSDDLTP